MVILIHTVMVIVILTMVILTHIMQTMGGVDMDMDMVDGVGVTDADMDMAVIVVDMDMVEGVIGDNFYEIHSTKSFYCHWLFYFLVLGNKISNIFN